jgi:hypothetical protein
MPVEEGPRRPLPDEFSALSAVHAPMGFIETGAKAGNPKGPSSTKVGWTLRDAQRDRHGGFAFLINPQGLTRTLGTRASLFATQGRLLRRRLRPGGRADPAAPARRRRQARRRTARSTPPARTSSGSSRHLPARDARARSATTGASSSTTTTSSAASRSASSSPQQPDDRARRRAAERVAPRAADDLLERYPYGEVKVERDRPRARRKTAPTASSKATRWRRIVAASPAGTPAAQRRSSRSARRCSSSTRSCAKRRHVPGEARPAAATASRCTSTPARDPACRAELMAPHHARPERASTSPTTAPRLPRRRPAQADPITASTGARWCAIQTARASDLAGTFTITLKDGRARHQAARWTSVRIRLRGHFTRPVTS